MTADPLAEHHRLRGRIRREELRAPAAPTAVPWRGIRLAWTQGAGAVSDPGVYVIPWTSVALDEEGQPLQSADITWASMDSTEVFIATAGLWAAQLIASATLAADSLYLEGARLGARINAGGAEEASEIGPPFPGIAADSGKSVGSVELELPPLVLNAGELITAELLAGFGTASPGTTHLSEGMATLDLYLICEI